MHQKLNGSTQIPIPDWAQAIYNQYKYLPYNNLADFVKTHHLLKKTEKNYNEQRSRQSIRTNEWIIKRLESIAKHLLKPNPIDKPPIEGTEGIPSYLSSDLPKFMQKKIDTNPQHITNKRRGYHTRLCLNENLAPSNHSDNPLRVFCDQDSLSSDPMLFSFKYLDENVIHLKSLDKKKQLVIKCTCNGVCSSETCECLILQKKTEENKEDLASIGIEQVLDNRRYCTNSMTSIMIVCGDLCGCPLSCSNRLENIIIKHRFEIFRRNHAVGFGFRTLNNILSEQLICECIGDLKKAVDLVDKEIRMNYSYELCPYQFHGILFDMIRHLYPDDLMKQEEWFAILAEDEIILDIADHAAPLHPNKLMEKEKGPFRSVLYLDPYSSGNIARFAAHGCLANAVMQRVICNYLHPAFHKLYFKACLPIPAGTEITFYYGNSFLKRNNSKCQCGTLICIDNEKVIEYWNYLSRSEQLGVLFMYYDKLENCCRERALKFDKFDPNFFQPPMHDDDDIMPIPKQENPEDLARNIENWANFMESYLSTSMDKPISKDSKRTTTEKPSNGIVIKRAKVSNNKNEPEPFSRQPINSEMKRNQRLKEIIMNETDKLGPSKDFKATEPDEEKSKISKEKVVINEETEPVPSTSSQSIKSESTRYSDAELLLGISRGNGR